jgi:hypothetical protein
MLQATVPWVVVSLHRPMYCSTGEGSEPDYGPNTQFQTALEPLLLQYDVDLVRACLPTWTCCLCSFADTA